MPGFVRRCLTPSLCSFALFLLIFHPTTSHAQGIITGSLTGFVADSSGAAVPNVSISAVNNSTGGYFKGVSSADGTFVIRDLPIGTYTVTITEQGFGKVTVQNAQVNAGTATSIGNRTLTPASSVETVEVAANSAALLDTTTAEGSATIESKELQELPVYGGFDTTALLVPGIVSTHGNGYAQSNGTDYSSNGLRSRSNNSELDGQANDDLLITGPLDLFLQPGCVAGDPGDLQQLQRAIRTQRRKHRQLHHQKWNE